MAARKRSQEEILKEAFKEALKEWMDEKFAAIGRWTFSTFLVFVVSALTTFILWTNGWKHVP